MEYLNVSDLRSHPQNDEFFDQISGEKWDLFLESINSSGVIEPLVVTQDKVIVSGHQRKRACEELGIETVPCRVVEYADKDGLTKEQQIVKDLIETNVRQRGDVGGSELKIVRRVDALCGIYGVKRGVGKHTKKNNCPNGAIAQSPSTVPEVCSLVGVPYKIFRNYSAMTQLTPDMIEKYESGEIPATVAAGIIAKLTSEQQQELIDLLPEGYISASVANDYVKRIKELEAENSWYDESEGATSEQVDALTMRIQDLETDNERLRERHQTVSEIKLKEDLENYKLIADQTIQAKQALIENLQKNVSADEEIEKKFVGMFVGLTSVVAGLADIPASALKLLRVVSKESIAAILENAVNDLNDLLSVVKEDAPIV